MYQEEFDKILRENGYNSVRDFIIRTSLSLNRNTVYNLRKGKGTLNSLEKLSQSLRVPLSDLTTRLYYST